MRAAVLVAAMAAASVGAGSSGTAEMAAGIVNASRRSAIALGGGKMKAAKLACKESQKPKKDAREAWAACAAHHKKHHDDKDGKDAKHHGEKDGKGADAAHHGGSSSHEKGECKELRNAWKALKGTSSEACAAWKVLKAGRKARQAAKEAWKACVAHHKKHHDDKDGKDHKKHEKDGKDADAAHHEGSSRHEKGECKGLKDAYKALSKDGADDSDEGDDAEEGDSADEDAE